MIIRLWKKLWLINVIQFVLIFVIIFVTFSIYRNYRLPYFLGEDSFYHVGMAKYMMNNGIFIHQFPYLQFTILKDHFIDWHFGFHLLLIPFIKVFGDINGPKILTSALVAGTFGVVYLIFKEKKFKNAFLYSLMLFFLMPGAFYFRMSLIRAPVLSLFLLILALYFFMKNKPILLASTIFIFVWSYYLASYFIFVPILAYILLQLLFHEKINYHLLLWALGGFALGLVINPFFPTNIYFFKYFYQIGSDNTRPGAGQEIFPNSTWVWFYSSIMTCALFFSGLFISIAKNIKQDFKNLALIVFAFVILILQWKSWRFVEYSPLIVGMVGFLIIGKDFELFLFNIKTNFKKIGTIIGIFALLIFIYEGIFHGIWEHMGLTQSRQSNQLRIVKLKDIASYLNQHSERGDIVFTRWDVFPELFYFNDKSYYVDGIDLMFIDFYDKKLSDEYVDISLNKAISNDPIKIKTDFNAKWVVVEKNNPLKDKLDKQKDIFRSTYDNENYYIYQVI